MDEPPGQPRVPRLIGIVSSSTGGCEALREILGNLPPDIPVPILVFPSINPRNFEWLATGLNAKSRFQVTMAEDDQVPQPGTVYVAVDDPCLIVVGGRLQLEGGNPEYTRRPRTLCSVPWRGTRGRGR